MARIAMVDLSFTWPPDGGARTDVREVAVRLARRHDVMLFVPEILGWVHTGFGWLRWPLNRTRFFWKGKLDSDPGFPVTPIPVGPLEFGMKRLGPRIRREVEGWNPDAVFVCDGWYLKPYVVLALADFRPILRIYSHEMLCLKGNGFFFRWGKACDQNPLKGSLQHLRCVVCTSAFYAKYPSPTWIHEFLMSRAFLPSYSRSVQRALAASRGVIVYNEFTADRVRPFSKSVKVVPSGVDAKRFSPEPSPQGAKDKKIILMMGRSEEPRKGAAVLLKAAEKLRRKRTDFEVWFTDNRKGGPEWVRHTGWISYDKMAELYRSIDVAAVPSLWPEPHGIVAVEAMACAKPVVVSRIGGLQSVCRDGWDGFQFPPGNSARLTEILDRLLDDESLRNEVGKRARSTAERRYDWDRIVNEEIEPLLLGDSAAHSMAGKGVAS